MNDIDWEEITEQNKNKLVDDFAVKLSRFIQIQPNYKNLWIASNDLRFKNIEKNLEIYSFSSQSDILIEYHGVLILAFDQAPNFRIKRQILSLIPPIFTKNTIIEVFDVTMYQVEQARSLKKQNYPGMLLQPKFSHRDKIDDCLIESFLDFICSDDYLQDVAYGTRNLNIAKGAMITIPNNIRLANHSKIIDDYKKMCENENLKSLSESTCYKILKDCGASFSKCLKGLDSMLADGMDAFDEIEKILYKLMDYTIEHDQITALISLMKLSRDYLQFDFKKHISFESTCTDHCAAYALDFTELCKNHLHTRYCLKCNTLETTLFETEKSIESLLIEPRLLTETLYQFRNHRKKIFNWKRHLIRGWTQDIIKYDVLNKLDDDSVYIHIDWAMKFEPVKFREKQEDFFGKNGLPWSVCCFVYLDNTKLVSNTNVHIFDNTSQDVDAVIGILDSVLENIHTKLGG